MIFTIDWGFVFQRHLEDIPSRHVAEQACAAILEFARTGKGPVEQYHPRDPRKLRLRVPGAVAYMYVDEHERVLYVGPIYRRST